MSADNPNEKALQDAYKGAYKAIDETTIAILEKKALPQSKEAFGNLLKAQNEWKETSLKGNKQTVKDSQAAEKKEVSSYLTLRIETLKQEIKDLEAQLPTNKALLPDVLDESGIPITADDLKKSTGKLISQVRPQLFDCLFYRSFQTTYYGAVTRG